MQHHKYSLTELENMLPWERKYTLHTSNYLEDQRLSSNLVEYSQSFLAPSIPKPKLSSTISSSVLRSSDSVAKALSHKNHN